MMYVLQRDRACLVRIRMNDHDAKAPPSHFAETCSPKQRLGNNNALLMMQNTHHK